MYLAFQYSDAEGFTLQCFQLLYQNSNESCIQNSMSTYILLYKRNKTLTQTESCTQVCLKNVIVLGNSYLNLVFASIRSTIIDCNITISALPFDGAANCEDNHGNYGAQDYRGKNRDHSNFLA